MTTGETWRLDATEATQRIRLGTITSEQLVRDIIARIEARDADVAAWSYFDPELAIAQARHLDTLPPRGPLHGVPVGIKDIITTRDMPTQYNSPLYEGHHPNIDATCVRLVRMAGGLILGKNDTVEFAVNGRRARTRNPHDLTRTPGGSSSGSAAAVADFQAPLSIGTQTGGSVIRPASYCGVFGFKPTWNLVSHEGFKSCAASIDTLGWFARCARDLRLLGDVLGMDPDPEPPLYSVQGLRIGICRSPVWPEAEPATQNALGEAVALLSGAGAELDDIELPADFEQLTSAHRVVMQSEMRSSFSADYAEFGDRLYPELVSTMRNDIGDTRADLVEAHDVAARCRVAFDRLAAPFDAILTPSARGEAPLGPDNTGEAVFNRIWTLLHVPVVNVPGLTGPNGLPIGLSLTGPRFSDNRLLRLAEPLGALFAGSQNGNL